MKHILYICCIIGLMACNSKKQETSAPHAQTPNGLADIQGPNNSPATTTGGQPAGNGAVNPPHGQPGHDCAIAVGAPLNTVSAQTVTQPAPPEATNVQPTTDNKKNVKLNPAHGEPGHRCDLAIGAPLS